MSVHLLHNVVKMDWVQFMCAGGGAARAHDTITFTYNIISRVRMF